MRGPRVARIAVGGLAVLAAACPDAVADETHGDVNLPPLTQEEIQELGLDTAPPAGDTPAPGAQDVEADQIPDNQDEGTPAPEEALPEAEAEATQPAPEPPSVPVSVAVPPPVPAAPSAPVPVAAPAPPAPASEALPPARQRERPARTRRAAGRHSIGTQAMPPERQVPVYQHTPPGTVAAPATRGRIVRPGESLWSIAAGLLGPGAPQARVAAEVERLWLLNRDRLASRDLLPIGAALRT